MKINVYEKLKKRRKKIYAFYDFVRRVGYRKQGKVKLTIETKHRYKIIYETITLINRTVRAIEGFLSHLRASC